MPSLAPELRELIASGPLTHLSTINADASPQVSVIWLGVDGDQLVTGHMRRDQLKLRNIARDPRVVLSFAAPRVAGAYLAHYAVLRARAEIEGPTEAAWELLDRLARVYMAPDATFPAPRGAGYIVRYTVERVSGVGPWA
jgi:PPOX class probable F420-dependent enzyme